MWCPGLNIQVDFGQIHWLSMSYHTLEEMFNTKDMTATRLPRSSRRSHCGDGAKRNAREKQKGGGVGSEYVMVQPSGPRAEAPPVKRGGRLRKRLWPGVSWSIDNGRRAWEQSSFTAWWLLCDLSSSLKRHFAKPSHVLNLWLCFWVLWFCFLFVFLFWVFFYFRFRISVSIFSSPCWAPK